MKRLLYILLILPSLLAAQSGLEARFYNNINLVSLSEVPEISAFDIDFGPKKDFSVRTFSDFNKINAKNYWQPVDMTAALANEENMQQSKFDIRTLNQKFDMEFGTGVYAPDGSSKVENKVYEDQRRFSLFNDYNAPLGVFVRASPYRFGNTRF